MKISFSYEHLFPAENRAGRHIETLLRRFQERGHEISVVTTACDNPVEPEGIEILRLRESPGAKGHARGDTLLGKAITRFLKNQEVEVHFCEGLTPLSAVTVKAAQRAGAKTVIRVLADATGIVHSLSSDRKLTPSALKKRVTTILRYADVAAASSERCAELLKDLYEGESRVIEKCVDLSVCDPERVQDVDIEMLREKFELGERPLLVYAREELRGETVASTIPLMKELRERRPEIAFLVSGKIEEGEALEEEIAEAGLEDAFRLTGPLMQRDLFAAYAAAAVYLAPHDSRASESELLESMAMACPIACFGAKAEVVGGLVEESGALVLPDDDNAGAAESLLALIDDADRLDDMSARARETAAGKDIVNSVNAVQHIFEELLELPLTDFSKPLPTPEEVAATHGADEEEEDEGAETEAEETDEVEADAEDSEAEDESEADAESEGAEEEVAEKKPRGKKKSADDAEDESESAEDEEGGNRRRRRRRRRRRLRHDEEGAEDESGESASAEAEEGSSETEKRDPVRDEEEFLAESSKRLRELDPKLTLRDLLPFLRPPKQVCVMSMASANGQHRAGDAIYEAFKSVEQNLRVKQVNIAEYLNQSYDPAAIEKLIDAEYREGGRSSAALLRAAEVVEREEASQEDEVEGESENEGDESARSPEATVDTPIPDKIFSAKLKNLILDKRPHQIILTHYLPVHYVAALKREHDLRMRIAVVITEYDLHPYWIAEGVDHYLASSEKVRYKLLRAGVPSSIIDVVGIPVHPRFDADIDRDRVRRDLGIRGNNPTVVMRPGGIGTTERILEVLEQITSVGYQFNLIVLGGRNDSLVKAVNSMKTPRGVNVKAFNFVENIEEVMAVADLLITRAVGHTVAEAFASGLPMLLLRPETAAEERTVDWFVERGIANKVHDSLDLEWLLTDLLRQQGRTLREMRNRASTGGRPRGGAAALTVEKIRRLLN